MAQKNTFNLYTLIPLEEFKSLLDIDDREDKIAKFCLVTSTLTIERYCKRQLLRKKHYDQFSFYGDLLLPLKEYPVTKLSSVSINCENVEPEFYSITPDCSLDNDIPFSITLSPSLHLGNNFKAITASYWAGYPVANIPADLSAACLELTSWNMNRYKGKHIGIARRTKIEHLETAIPENVRALLEPYRRKVI